MSNQRLFSPPAITRPHQTDRGRANFTFVPHTGFHSAMALNRTDELRGEADGAGGGYNTSHETHGDIDPKTGLASASGRWASLPGSSKATDNDLGSDVTVVVALFDYRAQRSDELDLCRGERVRVLFKDTTNWWTGELVHSGRQGFFMTNYVTSADDPSLLPTPRRDSLSLPTSTQAPATLSSATRARHAVDEVNVLIDRFSAATRLRDTVGTAVAAEFETDTRPESKERQTSAQLRHDSAGRRKRKQSQSVENLKNGTVSFKDGDGVEAQERPKQWPATQGLRGEAEKTVTLPPAGESRRRRSSKSDKLNSFSNDDITAYNTNARKKAEDAEPERQSHLMAKTKVRASQPLPPWATENVKPGRPSGQRKGSRSELPDCKRIAVSVQLEMTELNTENTNETQKQASR